MEEKFKAQMNGGVPQLKAICSQYIFNYRERDVLFLQHPNAVTLILSNLSKQPDPAQILLYLSSNKPKFIKSLEFNNTKLNNNGLSLLKRKN